MALVGHRVRELMLDAPVRFDAHLMPGDSTAVLMDSISVSFTEIHDDRDPVNRIRTAANATAGMQPAVTLEFDGGFEGSETAPHHALGITWDFAQGAARADMALPAPDDRLQNFMVRAIATARNGAEVTTAEVWVRVHLHGSLRNLWLTPNPLVVHRDAAASVRHTVLGEFDDGVVADLTQIIDTVPDWRGRISWQSSDDSVATVSAGGRVEGVSAGPATITLRVTQPGAMPDITASAPVQVVPPWATGAELRLEAGDADRRRDVPNILFLGEGMERDDEDAFDRIVDAVIDRLGKNHLIDPWPWVNQNLNYWSLFSLAPEPGMSRRAEYYVDDPAEDLRRGWTLPQPKRPANNATRWSLPEMVYLLGLPVPDDADVTVDDMLPRLRRRFGDHVTKERIEQHYGKWIKLANRTHVNDVDSAFHLVKGQRTRATVPDGEDSSIFELDPRRFNERDLRAFLGGLHFRGDAIGANLWGENGKDRALVCLLTRSTGRSVAMDDFFVVSLAHGARDDLEDATAVEVRISPFELPDAEFDDLDWLTYLFAHECGHAFGLGDEYGESDIDDKSPFARTDDSEAGTIELFPNLTALATLRTGTNEIDASRVKWGHWLRIADAAPVVGAPTVSGTRATVELRGAAVTQFPVGAASVRLRKRLCRRNADNDLAYRAHTMSGRLKVVGRPDATHVVLEADGAPATGETALADLMTVFAAGEGTILFTPTRQKMPGHIDPVEVPVMSPLVLSQLSTKDRPLNAKPDEPYVCKLNFDAVQQPRSLPSFPNNKPCYEPLIIGLYDGGRRNHCGTFHPGGICMMRDHSHSSDHRRFCSVCRFVLVDMMDPAQHGRLDRGYAKEYPH